MQECRTDLHGMMGAATRPRGEGLPPWRRQGGSVREGGPKLFFDRWLLGGDVCSRRGVFLSQLTTLLPSLPFSQPCSLSPSRFAPITMRSISSLVLLALCLAVAVSAAAAAEGESFVDSQREWFRNEMRRRGPQPPPLLLQLRPIPRVT